MAEVCAFKDNCPMSDDIIEIAGACSAKRGENCGRVAAYGMLKWQFEELAELDEEEPIDGTFTITQVPDGFPPDDIRQEWVDVQLPVRNMERADGSREVEISPADAILSLLSNGRLDAADWFIAAEIDFAPFGHSWVFQASEGDVQPVDPTTSVKFYGSKLTPEMREAVEQ